MKRTGGESLSEEMMQIGESSGRASREDES